MPIPKKTAEDRRLKAKSNRKAIIERASVAFKSLSDKNRLHICLILKDGEKSVTELEKELGCSQSVVSHHLTILRHTGVVTPRRDGHRSLYSLTSKAIASFVEHAELISARP